MPDVHIGTSGWHYMHWKGPFYPEDLPARRFLEYYAARFSTAEVNNTFYQLPKADKLEAWRETVPDDFVFTVKASRYLTHMKKLKDPAETLKTFYDAVAPLGEAIGPILFQLPPRWGYDGERLGAFLTHLSADYRHVFEFRDPSWFNADAFDRLAAHDAAFCIYELAGQSSPREVTTDLVYVRLHGPGDAYQGSYDAHALSGWAGAAAAWTRAGKTVYVYFDNDDQGHAVANAHELRDMVQG